MCHYKYDITIYACGHINTLCIERQDCRVPSHCGSHPVMHHPRGYMLDAARIDFSKSLCGNHRIRFTCCGDELRCVGSYLREIQARAFNELIEICNEYATITASDRAVASPMGTIAGSSYRSDFTSNTPAGCAFVQPWKDMSAAMQQVQVCSTNISQWVGPRVPGFDAAVTSVNEMRFNLHWLQDQVRRAKIAIKAEEARDAERINQFLNKRSETGAAPFQAGEEDEVEHIVQPATERALPGSPSPPAPTQISPETPEAPVGGPIGGPDDGLDGGSNDNGEGSSRTTQQIGEHRVAHHESLYSLNLEKFTARINSYRLASGGPQLSQSDVAPLWLSRPPPRSGPRTFGQALPSPDGDTQIRSISAGAQIAPQVQQSDVAPLRSSPPPSRSGLETTGQGLPSPDGNAQVRSTSAPSQIASQQDADKELLSADQSQGGSAQSLPAENTTTTREEAAMFNIPAGLRKAYQDRLEGHRRAVSTETNAEQDQQVHGPLQNASIAPTDAGTKEDQVVYLPRKRITNADIEGVLMDPETDDRMRAYLTSERLPEHGPHCMCAQCKEDNSAAWKIPQMRKPAYKKPAVAKTKAPGGFLQDVKGYGGEGQPPYFSSKELARRDRDADSSVLEAVIEMSGGNTSDKSRMGEVLEHFSKRK